MWGGMGNMGPRGTNIKENMASANSQPSDSFVAYPAFTALQRKPSKQSHMDQF